MKAAVLVQKGDSPEVFQIQDVPTPQPGDDEIQIQVSSFGLNYADVMARKGLYAAAPPLPSILGYEAVGMVSKIGKNVTQFKIGDRVLAFTRFGAYATYCVAKEITSIHLPNTVSDAQGTALATQYCTAIYMAKWKANIRANERILVHAAAGGVGHALIQIGKEMGCEIIGTVGSDEKVNHIAHTSISRVINYRQQQFDEIITQEYGPKAIDVVFDPIGGKMHKRNRRLLAIGGRQIMFGISSFSNKRGTAWDKWQLATQFGIMSPLWFLINSTTISGVNMLHIAEQKPEIIGALLQEAITGFQQGIYLPHIHKTYAVADLHQAHMALGERSTIGKVAVKW